MSLPIRRSYRKMALQFHPDKVTGSEAEKKAAAKKFAEINNAYEALSDPEKKKIYDQYGEEGLKQNQGGGGGGGGGGQNIFDMFFGGGGFGGFGGGQQEEQTPRGHDVYSDLYVSLKDLYLGREIQVIRDKAVIKPDKGKRQCKCKTVMKTRQLGPGMFQQFQEQKCEECPGVKLERESETLNVVIEPGVQHGHHITFFEEGEPMIDGDPGDLKLVVRQLYDPRWERRGDDLLINETISLVEALVGFSREIEHLDGHKVKVGVEGVTKPGDYQYVADEGMPLHNTAGKHGNLFVHWFIKFPSSPLDEQQKASINALGLKFA